MSKFKVGDKVVVAIPTDDTPESWFYWNPILLDHQGQEWTIKVVEPEMCQLDNHPEICWFKPEWLIPAGEAEKVQEDIVDDMFW